MSVIDGPWLHSGTKSESYVCMTALESGPIKSTLLRRKTTPDLILPVGDVPIRSMGPDMVHDVTVGSRKVDTQSITEVLRVIIEQ